MKAGDHNTNAREESAGSPNPAPNVGEATKAKARVKVLDPLTSTGPSMHAELIRSSATNLCVRASLHLSGFFSSSTD
jgi:hypothetical protein